MHGQTTLKKAPLIYYAYTDWLKQEQALSDAWFFKDGSQTSTILYADFLLAVSSKNSLVRSCSFSRRRLSYLCGVADGETYETGNVSEPPENEQRRSLPAFSPQ